jgi:hypothetical protein
MSQEHRQLLQNASSDKAACIRLLLVNYHLQGVVKTLGVLRFVCPKTVKTGEGQQRDIRPDDN